MNAREQAPNFAPTLACALCAALFPLLAAAATPAPAPAEKPAAAAPATPAAAAPDAPAAATAAPAGLEEAPAANAPRRNRSLEYARELVAKGRHEDALRELDTAAALPGNTNRIVAEIHATRAQALILQKKPNPAAARDLIVEVLHFDPDATLLADVAPAVKAVVDEVRANQPLVLHDRVAVARAGRPLKMKARVIDPKGTVASLTLHYKGHHVPTYDTEPMKKDFSGWSAFIRDTAALAPAGVEDGFFVDYFLTAQDAKGAVVDSNGSEETPISMEVSATKAEEAGLGRGVDLGAMLHVNDGTEAPVAVVEPEKAWWKRWYTIAGAGVVVTAITVGTIVALSEPDPLLPHIGVIHMGTP